MEPQIDWLKTLVRCKNRIKEQVRPLIETQSPPQKGLGIGAGGDPIEQVDLVAEDAILETLKELGTSFTLISEESGAKEYGSTPKEVFVVADPIDGSTNLIRGIPFYATSIAVSSGPLINTVHTALVADLAHDITYTARRRKGAHRNGKKISPSEKESLEDAVIGIDLNTYRVEDIAPRLTKLIGRTKHIRHLGANALELCYVADGTTDAFVDIRGKLRTTDIAAGWLIAGEAGAEITALTGEQLYSKLGPTERTAFIASGNRKIHTKILHLLNQNRRHDANTVTAPSGRHDKS